MERGQVTDYKENDDRLVILSPGYRMVLSSFAWDTE